VARGASFGPARSALNQYGNIPRGKLAALKADPNVFFGPVRLKDGQTINGVWERNEVERGARRGKLGRRSGEYGTKGSHNVKHNQAMGVTSLTTLKLLVRFTDPVAVKSRLPYQATAMQVVVKFGQVDAEAAIAKAIATMR
jgi:hypothetical protein